MIYLSLNVIVFIMYFRQMESTSILVALLSSMLNLNYAGKVCHVLHNRCIFIDYSAGRENFAMSSETCQMEGGKLVAITDAESNRFVLDILKHEFRPDYKLWIGLKMDHLKKWFYPNAQELNANDFENWAPGSMKKHFYNGYQCATIDVAVGQWHVVSCYYSYFGICEVPVSHCHTSYIKVPNAQFDRCITSTSMEIGTNISIKCEKGFLLDGPSFVTCTTSGWSEIPKCTPGCLLPELPSHVKIFNHKAFYDVGEKLMVYCDHGYLTVEKYMKTHQVVECQSGGTWPSLKKYCISEQQLKCQDHVCTEVPIAAKEDVKLTLKCPLDANGIKYPYSRWLKNHESLNSSDSEQTANETDLIIHHFSPKSAGIYTCIRGKNNNNVENVIIYVVTLSPSCPNTTIQNLPSVTVSEGESFYLSSKASGTKTDVKWFKDDKQLSASRNVRLLPNGDILIKKATYNDQGLYKYQLQSKIPFCFGTHVWDVYVNVKAESICGETDTEANQPWMVAMSSQQEVTPFCYGTLINDYWIISSAYCLSRFYRRRNTDVVAQFRLYIDQPEDNMQNFTWNIQIEHFTVHPQYSNRLGVNDIGLAKLKEPVAFSKTFKPICLSPLDFQEEHEKHCEKGRFSGLVSGWGSVEALTPGKMGPVLFENLTAATKELCQKYVAFQFPDKMFCATRISNSTATKMVGDSGSPFLVRRSGRYYLQGIFSWGERLAQVGKYDFFTKVASFYEWINAVVESN